MTNGKGQQRRHNNKYWTADLGVGRAFIAFHSLLVARGEPCPGPS
jgi:hypothetical protein